MDTLVRPRWHRGEHDRRVSPCTQAKKSLSRSGALRHGLAVCSQLRIHPQMERVIRFGLIRARFEEPEYQLLISIYSRKAMRVRMVG